MTFIALLGGAYSFFDQLNSVPSIHMRLNARKELAKELNYTGDTNDSAGMNIWLHKQVIAKIVANGGKIPADLKH